MYCVKILAENFVANIDATDNASIGFYKILVFNKLESQTLRQAILNSLAVAIVNNSLEINYNHSGGSYAIIEKVYSTEEQRKQLDGVTMFRMKKNDLFSIIRFFWLKSFDRNRILTGKEIADSVDVFRRKKKGHWVG